MSIIQSIVLGLIQGITEFLPISSSGHLIIIREFFGLPLENSLGFDVLLHFATLLVILIYFSGDITRIMKDAMSQGLGNRSSKLLWAMVLGSIPVVVLGYLGGNLLENTFRNSEQVAYTLILGSILFFVADRFNKSQGGISPLKGFFIGIFQSLSLIPGFSRSGTTISGGLLSGLSREEAIKFAFLLGVPAILGAIIKILFLDVNSIDFNLTILLGFFSAFLSGLWAVRFLVRYLSSHSFTIFIIYRLFLAGFIIIFL